MIHESLCPRVCCAQRGEASLFQRMPRLSSLLFRGAGTSGEVTHAKFFFFLFVVVVLVLLFSLAHGTPSCLHEVTDELLPFLLISVSFIFLSSYQSSSQSHPPHLLHVSKGCEGVAEGRTLCFAHDAAQQPPLLVIQTLRPDLTGTLRNT